MDIPPNDTESQQASNDLTNNSLILRPPQRPRILGFNRQANNTLFHLPVEAFIRNSQLEANNNRSGCSSNIENDSNNNTTNEDSWTTEVSLQSEYPAIWNECRKNKLLCDAILRSCDGQTFYVHRIILSASSPYFTALFSTPLNKGTEISNSNNNRKQLVSASGVELPRGIVDTINLNKIDSKILNILLDFSYTGECDIDEESVERLLQIADEFQLVGLVSKCCQFLRTNLRPENCLRIFQYVQAYFCPTLRKEVKLFILHNFKKIMKSYPNEFNELEFRDIEDILGDDLLNVNDEELIFETIKNWVTYKTGEEGARRLSRIVELLQTIRLGLLTYEFFTNKIIHWDLIANNVEVQNSLAEATVFLSNLDSRANGNVETDLNDPIARPRIPYELVFAIGGWSAGSPTSFMETYDCRADRWFLVNAIDISPRAYHGLVALGHLIYMIGGFDGQDHFNTVRSFDPASGQWTEKSCMHHPRCYVSCCSLDDKIFAIGGYNGRSRMNSVEMYTESLNQWDLIAPMNRNRSDASACSFKGKVYVAGGFNGQEVLNSVEVYNLAEGQWTYIHPMQSPRSGISLAVYRDHIYALGGFNGFVRLNTSERYSPTEPGEWQAIGEMSSPRSNFSAVVVDEMILAIGGFNGTTTIPYVECYDGDINSWYDASHMNLNRSALSACVLKGLPNAREYSYLARVEELLGVDP